MAGYFEARGVDLPKPNFLNGWVLTWRCTSGRALPRAAVGEPLELFNLPGKLRPSDLQRATHVLVSRLFAALPLGQGRQLKTGLTGHKATHRCTQRLACVWGLGRAQPVLLCVQCRP